MPADKEVSAAGAQSQVLIYLCFTHNLDPDGIRQGRLVELSVGRLRRPRPDPARTFPTRIEAKLICNLVGLEIIQQGKFVDDFFSRLCIAG